MQKGILFRTKKGIIRKWSEYDVLIKEWEDRFNYNDEDGDLNFVFEDEIAKYSNNIINLIKVGDYVNGEKVTSAEPVDKNDTDRYLGFGDYDYYIHDNEDIKDVVTKEQFNSMKYVVERDK